VGRLAELRRKIAAVTPIARSKNAYQVRMVETLPKGRRLPMGRRFANWHRGWERDHRTCVVRETGGSRQGVSDVSVSYEQI
jgi:hypothetical protein